MSQPAIKAVYRIRNWREYNQALVRRGSLTVWVDEQALAVWDYQGPSQWGGQYVYSDVAIQPPRTGASGPRLLTSPRL